MCHLSESFWTTNSNKRQADSCDKSSECHEAERDSTALGRGSDVLVSSFLTAKAKVTSAPVPLHSTTCRELSDSPQRGHSL
jgi:hypothetical protein